MTNLTVPAALNYSIFGLTTTLRGGAVAQW